MHGEYGLGLCCSNCFCSQSLLSSLPMCMKKKTHTKYQKKKKKKKFSIWDSRYGLYCVWLTKIVFFFLHISYIIWLAKVKRYKSQKIRNSCSPRKQQFHPNFKPNKYVHMGFFSYKLGVKKIKFLKNESFFFGNVNK